MICRGCFVCAPQEAYPLRDYKRRNFYAKEHKKQGIESAVGPGHGAGAVARDRLGGEY